MTLKDYIKQLETRKAALSAEVKDCDDVARLKAINVELDQLNGDIANLRALSIGENDPDGRTKAVNSAVPSIAKAAAPAKRDGDITDSMEYREAFKEYILHGTKIPAELRSASATTSTSGSVIPTVIVDRIVEEIENVGMILPRVTRTFYQAGVSVPTSTAKPTASWVNEGASSDYQSKATSYISFTYHKLRCEISMSMEVATMAISAFERTFVDNVATAMVKAIEQKIVSTDAGSSNPKGILAETPVSGQALTTTSLTYADLVACEGALPEAYESGAVWVMSKKTFMQFVGMVDTVGQPIARVNYGIGGKPERYLLGREVICCDYVPNFANSLSANTVFAFIFRLEDYMLNTIYDLGIREKEDWDTEDVRRKAVMSVDGKVIDKNSLVTLAMGS